MPLKGHCIWGEVKLFPFPCLRIQAKLWPERSLAPLCIPTFSLISQHLPSHSLPRWKSNQSRALVTLTLGPSFHIFSPCSSPSTAPVLWDVTQAPPPFPDSSPKAGQDSLCHARPVTGTAGSTKSPQAAPGCSNTTGAWGKEPEDGPQAQPGLCQSCWHIHEILWRHRAVSTKPGRQSLLY